MAQTQSIKVGPLKVGELKEASRIMRLAFGTFLGLPNPLEFMGDRDFMTPRWRSANVKVLAAREGRRLVGTNLLTRWGSFGFFGPLTVLPEYWDRKVAQLLLERTINTFDRWGLKHSGLFTFPHSAKHVGLYQKFGYWPGYLTAIMKHTPSETGLPKSDNAPILLSKLARSERVAAIKSCERITDGIEKGLDLGGEIRAVLAQRAGDVVLRNRRGVPEAFAVCMNGAGSEGGKRVCYIKFGAARNGDGFDRLLDACESFAISRDAELEAGVNLACEDAFWRMRAHGYQAAMQGVAMQRPHVEGFNRADVYVMNDWR